MISFLSNECRQFSESYRFVLETLGNALAKPFARGYYR
jgi:hypothetical protein